MKDNNKKPKRCVCSYTGKMNHIKTQDAELWECPICGYEFIRWAMEADKK